MLLLLCLVKSILVLRNSFLSLFFNLFTFHYLSSKPLIHSSTSFILLFIPSSMFLISFIEPVTSGMLLLISLFRVSHSYLSPFFKVEYLYDHCFKFSIWHVAYIYFN